MLKKLSLLPLTHATTSPTALTMVKIRPPPATSLTIATGSSVIPRISDTQLHPRASPGRREDEDEIVGREDHNLDETKGKIVECFVIENLWA